MDYVVGSVAALISGNVTPNRPKLVRRALTPMKHQPSPNVTPKSELVNDRSIFLSPSIQKKKAIVKKSPKRIFQNPDLDVTQDSEKNCSPKADKVKKHLKEDLESKHHTNVKFEQDEVLNKDMDGPQSANESTPKKKKKKNLSPKVDTMNKSSKDDSEKNDTDIDNSPQSVNENTPKKKKNLTPISNKMKKPLKEDLVGNENYVHIPQNVNENTSKKKKKRTSAVLKQEHDTDVILEKKKPQNYVDNASNDIKVKKEKKHLETEDIPESCGNNNILEGNVKSKKKNKKKKQNTTESNSIKSETIEDNGVGKKSDKKLKKKKMKTEPYVNPNAITSKDTDSEHESDNEIFSENEEANKEILDTGPDEESSDEENNTAQKKAENKDTLEIARTEDEIKRTLFVGNVPLTKKCKKEIKKIFNKYGPIETVRIRTVPVKDARVTPKVAVITNELHPDRTTVNVYVKFKNESSVQEALAENNSVVNGCHLRVTRSDQTGAEHDPRCAIFVGNVPFALEDDQLRDKFAGCGKIDSVRIIRDKKTNAGKGFAYVNFASKDGVELALALTEEDLTIKNRILRVKRCTQGAQQHKNKQIGNSRPQPNGSRNSFGNKVFKPRTGQETEARLHGGKPVNKSHSFGRNAFHQRGSNREQAPQGAQRRLINKRPNQDAGEGPAAKKQHLNQPQKEKKVRKEFVGLTSEKKKKNTFTKGQKKKRALSEILTKYKN